MILSLKDNKRPISKLEPISAAIKAMPHSGKIKTKLEEVLDEDDFSKFYSESVEFKPFSFSPNSYEREDSEEEVLFDNSIL